MTSLKQELFRREAAAWAPLHDLAHEMAPDEAEVAGYYEEGWSAKDVLAHVACWYAESARSLLRIREGTYEAEEQDEDEVNRRFLETCRDLSLRDVMAQLHASRTRMLEELDRLPDEEVEGPAETSFRESGIEHPPEHVPRLREWLASLRGGSRG